MKPSGSITAVVIIQLVIGFITLLLGAFCAACFGPEFGYGVVWWSFSWTLVIACLRWYSHSFHRSVVEQVIHLTCEVFAVVSWIVATAVMVALNVRLNRLKKEYDYDVHNNIQLSDELVTHQFSALGMGGLYCSYALNAVVGIMIILLLLSTHDSIRLLLIARRKKRDQRDIEYKYSDNDTSTGVSTQETLVPNRVRKDPPSSIRLT